MGVRFLLLIIAFSAFASVQAQFVLQPKWQPGISEQLEYTYSRHKTERDTPAEFDTTHALINTVYIREDKNLYYFEWYYTNYYDNSDTAQELLPKVTNMALTRFLTRAQFNFSISKIDGALNILNQQELDSLQESVIGTIIDSLEKEDVPDFYQLMGLSFKFETRLFDNLHSLINSYYMVYSISDIQRNKKRTIDEAGQAMLKQLDDVSEAYEGYGLFSDTEPDSYQLQMYLKADVTLAMMLQSDMADLALALKQEDGDVENAKKMMGNKGEPAPPSYMTVELNVKLDKATMQVSYYNETVNTDASATPFQYKEATAKVIRKLK